MDTLVATLLGMPDVKFTQPAQVRTLPAINAAFDGAVSRLRHLFPELRLTGTKVNRENVTAALWSWFANLPEPDARAFVAAMFEELQKQHAREDAARPEPPAQSGPVILAVRRLEDSSKATGPAPPKADPSRGASARTDRGSRGRPPKSR